MPTIKLFYGAGMSYSSGIPNASRLYEQLLQNETLAKAAKVYTKADPSGIKENVKDLCGLADACACDETTNLLFKQQLSRYISISASSIGAEYRMLALLLKKRLPEYTISTIYTTNQDYLLESILESNGIEFNRYTNAWSTNITPNLNGNVDIIKLCGDIHNINTICFSTKELTTMLDSAVGQRLQQDLYNHQFTFIGYSFSTDPLGERIKAILMQRTGSIIIDPFTNEVISQLDRHYHTHTPISAEHFFIHKLNDLKPHLRVKHLVFKTDGVGGVQTYYYSLKRWVQEYSDKLTFQCDSIYDYFTTEQIDAKNAFGLVFLKAAAIAQVHDLAANDNYDVIHAHDFISAYYASQLGLPVVYTSHSLQSKEQEFAEGNEKSAFEEDASDYEKRYYPKIPIIRALSESHIKTIPSGIRHAARWQLAPFLLTGCEALDDSVLDKIKCFGNGVFDRNKYTIAFIGRSAKRKGLGDLISALNRIMNTRPLPDFQALFIGPDFEPEEITAISGRVTVTYEREKSGTSGSAPDRETIQLEKADRMFHIKLDIQNIDDDRLVDQHIAKLRSLYSVIKAVAIPSYYEPFGYVALEAMANGCLVLANDVGGLKEIVGEHQERGVLVKSYPNMSEAFYYTCLDAIKDKHDAAKKIKNGYAWLNDRYSGGKIKGAVDEMYLTYLSAIINNNSLLNDTGNIFNESHYDKHSFQTRLATNIKDLASLNDILVEAAREYRSILRTLGRERIDEAYDLFWEMAKWIKQARPLHPAIRIISLNNLAELLTQVERLLV